MSEADGKAFVEQFGQFLQIFKQRQVDVFCDIKPNKETGKRKDGQIKDGRNKGFKLALDRTNEGTTHVRVPSAHHHAGAALRYDAESIERSLGWHSLSICPYLP